jgi:hypothetical protein
MNSKLSSTNRVARSGSTSPGACFFFRGFFCLAIMFLGLESRASSKAHSATSLGFLTESFQSSLSLE